MSKGPTHRQPGAVKLMAVLFLARTFTFYTFLALVIAALVDLEKAFLLWATGGALLLWIVLSLIHLIECSRCGCAVCTTSLFEISRKKGRRINERTKSFLGSYRLRRSLSVLLKNYYHCNHCGERVACVKPSTDAEAEPLPEAIPANSEEAIPEQPPQIEPGLPPKKQGIPGPARGHSGQGRRIG